MGYLHAAARRVSPSYSENQILLDRLVTHIHISMCVVRLKIVT